VFANFFLFLNPTSNTTGVSDKNSTIKDSWNLTNAKVELNEEKLETSDGIAIIMQITLDMNIPSNAASTSTINNGILLLRHYQSSSNTTFNIHDAANEWKNSIEYNVQKFGKGCLEAVYLWNESRKNSEWRTKFDERILVDLHVTKHTDLRIEEYKRLVLQAHEDETLYYNNEERNAPTHGSKKSYRKVPFIPPSPSKPPPTPSKLLFDNLERKNSIVLEADDDEEEDAPPSKGDSHIKASTPMLTKCLENVTKRKGVTGVEFFDIVNQRKRDGSIVYRQKRVVVITLTHLLTYKLSVSKKKW